MRSRGGASCVLAAALSLGAIACVPRAPRTPVGARAGRTAGVADRPSPRTDQNSLIAHAELGEKAKTGRIDVYFVGDSITRRWGALDYPELLANWTSNFFGWNAANFGWGADRIQHILWRLENGELDGVRPKVIVVLAGTNNVGAQPVGDETIADVTRGLVALVEVCKRRAPGATIVLTAIFPRNDNMALVDEIDRINGNLARLADGRTIRFLDVNDKLADKEGRLFDGVSDDQLHPTVKGYQIWADGLKPIFTELLGRPAAIDLAPPPTGDPSARGRGTDSDTVDRENLHAMQSDWSRPVRRTRVEHALQTTDGSTNPPLTAVPSLAIRLGS